MDSSPATERRAQLIREMAQDLNRTRQSLGSNSDFADLTGSHLSIEEESSQAYKSQTLPHLPTDHRRSSRFASAPSHDFVIDTSAIGRAFPDMTGSGSSIDDGSSISIEIGRGLKSGTRNLSDDGESRANIEYDGRYKVDLSKLPRRNYHVGRGALQDLSTNIEPTRNSPPPMKDTKYGTSGSSRQSSVEVHRPGPPKVTVEDAGDDTRSTDSKPSTQNITARSTRFQLPVKDSLPLPKRFTSKDLLQKPHDQTRMNRQGSRTPIDNPTITSTNAGTVQSFMLPNMPNMSELVSGIYDDGTPVFSRKGSSRFANHRKSPAVRHSAVPSIPVPEDEEAIMMSLRLLRQKIAELEKNKAESQVVILELQEKNRTLEDEKREWRRGSRHRDSGVGSSGGSDAGDEGMTETRKAVIERNRLQTTIRNLQNELEGANRRASIAETNLENVVGERDSVLNQIGLAFVTHEQIKVDNEALKAEVQRLELEVKKYRSAIESYIRGKEQESEPENTGKTGLTKSKVTDDEPSGQDARSVDCQVLDVDTPKRPTTRRELSRTDVTRGNEPAVQVEKRRKRRVVVEEYTVNSDLDTFIDRLEHEDGKQQGVSRDTLRNLSRNVSQPERPISRAQSIRQAQQDKTKDVTQASQISYLQDGDITMLRKMLEKEHLVKKGRLQSKGKSQADAGDITQLTNYTSRSRGLPRKSSMKDLTGRLSTVLDEAVETEDEVEATNHSRATSQHRRRHSDVTAATSKAGKSRLAAMEDMTSAFILPDITMSVRQRRASQAKDDLTGKVSLVAPEILVNGAPHDPSNCTICTRVHGFCSHDCEEAQADVNIPQPIPVSDRIADLALDGEDHTTRPSEPPADALARTIKALEDEYQHLGIQIAELQAVMNDLDPSLQKRKRKSLGERIDQMRSAMDAKADQVYALYDVLEGQKQAGRLQDMTKEQLEETLSSVLGGQANMNNLGMPSGVMFKRGLKTSSADVTPAKERAKPRKMSEDGDADRGFPKTPVASMRKMPWDESYEDEDAASLPWEGFDDTIDFTKESRVSNTSSRRRRSIGL